MTLVRCSPGLEHRLVRREEASTVPDSMVVPHVVQNLPLATEVCPSGQWRRSGSPQMRQNLALGASAGTGCPLGQKTSRSGMRRPNRCPVNGGARGHPPWRSVMSHLWVRSPAHQALNDPLRFGAIDASRGLRHGTAVRETPPERHRSCPSPPSCPNSTRVPEFPESPELPNRPEFPEFPSRPESPELPNRSRVPGAAGVAGLA